MWGFLHLILQAFAKLPDSAEGSAPGIVSTYSAEFLPLLPYLGAFCEIHSVVGSYRPGVEEKAGQQGKCDPKTVFLIITIRESGRWLHERSTIIIAQERRPDSSCLRCLRVYFREIGGRASLAVLSLRCTVILRPAGIGLLRHASIT